MRMKKKAFKLLIFDLDGTLTDSLQDLTHAANFSRAQFGLPEISSEKVRQYIGDGRRALMDRALNHPNEADLTKGVQLFNQHYDLHFLDNTRLYDGARKVLDVFSGTLKTVLTNKPEVYAEKILNRLDLNKYFEMLIGGRDDMALKPAPDGILAMLDRFKIAPEDAVMIGDSETDVLAGKAAGVATCAVSYGFRSGETLQALGPDWLIDHPLGLKDLFVHEGH